MNFPWLQPTLRVVSCKNVRLWSVVQYVLVTSFKCCDNKTQDLTNLRTLEEAKEEDEEASIAL